MNEFDRVAPFYDSLARCIFGTSIWNAQRFFLHAVSQGSKVLILGGGTGRVLEELLSMNSTCTVWYVEASEEMLERTKRRPDIQDGRTIFIHGTEDDLPRSITYDAVIMQFYLDLFPDRESDMLMKKLEMVLHPGSTLFVTDFINTTWWHSAMLRVMYRFFRLTARIRATSLPAWERNLKEKGFRETQHQFFFGGFIKSSLFEVPA
jgi:ubiquinone/menaquinone biosynthesis C-methylase UbiE